MGHLTPAPQSFEDSVGMLPCNSCTNTIPLFGPHWTLENFKFYTVSHPLLENANHSSKKQEEKAIKEVQDRDKKNVLSSVCTMMTRMGPAKLRFENYSECSLATLFARIWSQIKAPLNPQELQILQYQSPSTRKCTPIDRKQAGMENQNGGKI